MPTFCLGKELLTLEQALTLSQQHSPYLKAAKYEMDTTKAGLLEAWSKVLPSISIEASRARYDSYQTRFFSEILGQGSAPTSIVNDTYTLKANVTQPIFNTALYPTLKGAGLSHRAALDTFRRAQQTVRYDTIVSFAQVDNTINKSKLASENATILSRHLETVNIRFRKGLLPYEAVLNAKVSLKQAETEYKSSLRDTNLARNQFNIHIGRPLTDKTTLIPFIPSQNIELKPKETYITLAFENRPDYQALTKLKILHQYNISINRKDAWPIVTATGSYGYINGQEFTLDDASRDWFWNISATWTLFNGFATKSKVDVAKIKYKNTLLSHSLMEDTIRLEVENAHLSIQVAQSNVHTSAISSKLAGIRLQKMQVKFRSGKASNQEVLDAQFANNQAKNSHLLAIKNLHISTAKLNTAVGNI
ncbi:MAG: TolC family protein [Candidatus Margulisbacteria bacterium]|nr:TolC family protein [Candidatus Margulisiibacteriota bacterium]